MSVRFMRVLRKKTIRNAGLHCISNRVAALLLQSYSPTWHSLPCPNCEGHTLWDKGRRSAPAPSFHIPGSPFLWKSSPWETQRVAVNVHRVPSPPSHVSRVPTPPPPLAGITAQPSPGRPRGYLGTRAPAARTPAPSSSGQGWSASWPRRGGARRRGRGCARASSPVPPGTPASAARWTPRPCA